MPARPCPMIFNLAGAATSTDGALSGSNTVMHAQLEPASSEGVPANVTCEAAMLAAPLAPGKSTTLESYAVLIHQLAPRPKEVEQGDPQRVVLRASQHILAPYRMASESLQVLLAAGASIGTCPAASPCGSSKGDV